MEAKYYQITPVTKPRMTQRDKFKRRPNVVRYWAYRDEVRLRKVKVPVCGYHITFIIPMPKSWKEEDKAYMNGRPHQQTPDKDNLEKALLDAVYDNDCKVWDGRVTKRWGREGAIIIGECADG